MGTLTWRKVETAKAPGNYGDGDGLYLQVTQTGRSWIFRYQLNGRRREMGLGSIEAVTLATARDLAGDARKLVAKGTDPIEHRKAEREAARLALASQVPFREVAEAFIKAASPRWKASAETSEAEVWRSSLERLVYPTIGTRPVGAIGTDDVVKVLTPIWQTRHVTALRLRQRIEQILDFAAAKGHRPEALNPARWKGHVKNLLPILNGAAPEHHAALPWHEMPALMRELAGVETVSAMALQWTVLTVARAIEVRRAAWKQLDLEARTWACPPSSMKRGRSHVVPLCAQGMVILEKLKVIRMGDVVFPGQRRAAKLSASAMLECLQKLRPDATVHGLRAAFRTWVADTRRQDRDLAEVALSHAIEGDTEAAYQRGDYLEQRRALMQAWADFLHA